jgi:hypothetical protein
MFYTREVVLAIVIEDSIVDSSYYWYYNPGIDWPEQEKSRLWQLFLCIPKESMFGFKIAFQFILPGIPGAILG